MKKILFKMVALCLGLICLLGAWACTPDKAGDNGSLTKAQYSTVFGKVTSTCSQAILPTGFSAGVNVNEEDLIPLDSPMAIQATIWFVGFLKNVCDTEDYVLTKDYTEAIAYTLNGGGREETYKLRFNMSYDKSTKVIKSGVYAYDFTNDLLTYLEFEVKYDFSNNQLTAFSMQGAMGKTVENSMVMCLYYKNNQLKVLDTTSATYQQMQVVIKETTLEHFQTQFGDNLPDYSDQYNSANPANATVVNV